MSIIYPHKIGICCLALLATACAVGKKYEQPKEQPLGAQYRDKAAQDSTMMGQLPWDAIFPDSLLRALIEQGLAQNFDLKIALARMESAAANVKQARAAFYPTLTANAQVANNQNSPARARASGINVQNIPINTIYELTGTTTWEIDVWGKLRSGKRAAAAALLQSDAYRRLVETQLIASIATFYYQLLAYDEQITFLESTVSNRRKDVEIVKELKRSGIVTGADIANSEANVRAAELQLPDLLQLRRETENALASILAMPADSIPRSTLAVQPMYTDLAAGIPAQLLANRPDVQQAEFAFQNAFELTNVARTNFYPSLSISGNAGWATANTLQGFFSRTFYGNLLNNLTQPIFNQGLNKRNLRVAQAVQQEAYYTFQNTLLLAGQEVNNALYAYNMGLEKERIRKLQITDLERATDFTKELLRYTSNTNYVDVLTAEQNLLSAQLNAISDRLQQFTAVVEVYRALGGGWSRLELKK